MDMLVDKPMKPVDPIMQIMGDVPFRKEKWIYWGSTNFSHALEQRIEFENEFFSMEGDRYSYWVCDDLTQLKEYLQPEIDDPNNEYIISYKEMRKDTEPESGGWRWHKWGTYIWNQEPQCEYLYDEPIIKSVLVFHIYKV